MLTYDRAIEVVANFIVNCSNDTLEEVEWLLTNVFPEDKMDELVEGCELNNKDLWKIKEYVDEEDTD